RAVIPDQRDLGGSAFRRFPEYRDDRGRREIEMGDRADRAIDGLTALEMNELEMRLEACVRIRRYRRQQPVCVRGHPWEVSGSFWFPIGAGESCIVDIFAQCLLSASTPCAPYAGFG